MNEALQITPQGHIIRSIVSEATVADHDAKTKQILEAFERSASEGLFRLASQPIDASDVSLQFWSAFASEYLKALCQTSASDPSFPDIAPPGGEILAFTILNAPPMLGAEYLNTRGLAEIWEALHQWIGSSVADSGLGLSDWLKQNAPHWHQIGRVCFHLAENKNDPECPFAFMATYAPRIAKSGRVQFQALAQALKEYAGSQNREKLIALLEPVHNASKEISFVAELVETNDVYHPLAWTPTEAYAFLKAIPQLERNGLLTQLPNWWKSRPRPKVSVSIGANEKRRDGLGMDSMLSFQASVALGDKTLKQEEIDALLKSDESLIKLNGQWVEIDQEKLEQALDHWKRIEEHAANGDISFAQGMRLLAGAQYNLAKDGPLGDEESENIREWSTVQADGPLAATLAKLRDPTQLAQRAEHPNFNGKLRPYQQDGFNWLHLLAKLGLGACLADDMGLGKTIQVIALLLALKKNAAAEQPPSLLVLPASLLANWKSEFAQFAPSLKLRFAHPSECDKQALHSLSRAPKSELEQTDVVLTTYGMLLRQDWIVQQSWNLTILDEAQAIKNPNSQQTRTAKKLQSRSRIAITGTPIENKLGDLWSLFDFICPDLLGSAATFGKFSKDLKKNPTIGYGSLRKLISPYILRRLKTDRSVISDLPEKTEIKAYCHLVPKQAALYQRAVNELKKSLEIAEGIDRKGLVLTYLMRFKQICNHPSQSLGDNTYEAQASGKFDRLRELCEEIAARQEKALIFTQFREMIDPLAEFLSQIFGRPGLVLHGGTPIAQRKTRVDAFQEESGPPFFILSLKAGGSGLTLTAASHVIHFDRWWNPAVENQATDRAFRIGQKKNVLVHKFVSRGTIEEKVDRLIESKNAISDGTLKGSSETNLTELSDEELLHLVSLDIAATQ